MCCVIHLCCWIEIRTGVAPQTLMRTEPASRTEIGTWSISMVLAGNETNDCVERIASTYTSLFYELYVRQYQIELIFYVRFICPSCYSSMFLN